MGGGGHQWWGTPQIHQVGFYEYGTSPFHMKLFKGFFNPGISKVTKIWGKKALLFAPPVALFYGTAVWADKKFEYYNRKAYLMHKEDKN